METYIKLIFLLFALAELSIQIATSNLSDKFKRFLFLSIPFKFNALLYISSWKKVSGIYFYWLFPFILVFIVLGRIWKFIGEMIDCPFCIGYHLGWVVFYLTLDMSLISSLLLAPLVLVGVRLLYKLNY